MQEEIVALCLTAGREDADLVEDLQMREGNNIHLRCWVGRLEEWTILGYEEGYPVIWLSTKIAEYDCIKPSSSNKIFYDHFFAKASARVEVFKTVTISSGGFSDLSLDKQLAAIFRALSVQKFFSNVASIKDFILPQGEFIYKQLIGLDETSKESDNKFIEAGTRVEVYKTVTTSSGGFSDLSLDEQLAAIFRALSVQKCFSNVVSIKDFILPQGEFIYKQLIGLDETSKKSDNKFIELPVLAALRD
ncbi:DNA (cytosine-5)-methyltransferase 1 [Abeliophyllum distichum]|uniref:DNA (Cytosine-5)-methyltransferase 1 n=1 Tax=Abeliophyllum distichum TaxID=126358 RepID=A0ABD1VDD1_9LAMI